MKHLLMRVEGDLFLIKDNRFIHEVFETALKAANATIIKVVKHKYKPQGLSRVALLAESHASVHTWPEKGFAILDYFSCAENPHVEEFEDVWFRAGFAIVSREVIER